MVFSLNDHLEMYVLAKRAQNRTVGEHGFSLLARYTQMKKMWEDMYRKNIEGFSYTGFLHYAIIQSSEFKQFGKDAFIDFNIYEL